jgi:hypothetical protein
MSAPSTTLPAAMILPLICLAPSSFNPGSRLVLPESGKT